MTMDRGDEAIALVGAVMTFFDADRRTGQIYRITGDAWSWTPDDATGGTAVADGSGDSWRLAIIGFRPNIEPTFVASEREIHLELTVDGSIVDSAPGDPDVQALRILALLDPRVVVTRARSRVRLPDRDILECELDLRDFALPPDYIEWLGSEELVRSVRVVYGGPYVSVWQRDVPPQQSDTIVVHYE